MSRFLWIIYWCLRILFMVAWLRAVFTKDYASAACIGIAAILASPREKP